MLEKLLREIRAGSTLQTTTLAARLGTSVAMVQAMLEELERMGLLHQVPTGCSTSSCGGCPMTGGCADPGRVWMLKKTA